MKRLILPTLIGLMIQLPAMADTVITADNLTKFETLLPKLTALDNKNQASLNQDLDLKPHCNWQQQYTEIKAQQADSAYIAQAEQLINQSGFQPAQFLELSAKITWPMLDAVMPMLQMTQQALAFMPEEQRKELESSFNQSNRYHKAVGNCLTVEDKQALEKYKQRIMQIASDMSDDDDNDGMDIKQLMKMGNIN